MRSEDVSAAATTGLGEGVDSTKALAARGTARREVEAKDHFNFGSDLHGRPTAVPVQEGESARAHAMTTLIALQLHGNDANLGALPLPAHSSSHATQLPQLP